MKLKPLMLLVMGVLLVSGCSTQSRLLSAARRGNLHDAEQALLDGADVNTRDSAGNSALHLVATRDVTKLVLAARGDGDWLNPETYRQFGNAASEVLLLNLLLRNGAEVNATNNQGMTPLHIAAEHNSPHTALLLVARGGDLLRRDRIGRTPLELAARSGYRDFLEILLREGKALPTHYRDELRSTIKDFGRFEEEGGGGGKNNRSQPPEPATK